MTQNTSPPLKKITLVADFGNSQCKLGRFDDGVFSGSVSIPYNSNSSNSEENKANLIGEISTLLSGVSALYAISVVSEKQQDAVMALLKKIVKRPLNQVLITNKQLSEQIHTSYPLNELGTDRLINVLAGKKTLPDHPFIVIDIGTATTLDVYCPDNGYLGGLIVPGFHPFWNTLNTTTHKLPAPEIQAVANPIGQNTHTSIQRGLALGYVGMLNTLIHDLQTNTGSGLNKPTDEESPQQAPPKVIWTGGSSSAVLSLAEKLGHTLPCDHHDDTLTLKGIYQSTFIH